ncbi:transcriptional regulator [Rhodococcus sp. 15-725-2-2b]|uniref:helix-turn-helix domain-containing protein n=1 Tax=unclassified Rhodococcus (in: high G+C Gram-positive bacteria) TaxID=192944 RepID=UPI000B9B3A42|nr:MULTISPECIES: helix-turn-helix domain-containing protein [unclassified Rhodococcus (in: high G+C Gram-positive bacteria)]OZC64832.1 transcriptional regulator [Rhodococcus sp. 06-469-3-2]OZD46665.1 transcriptional regulator [Rhodococcus sp. 06-1477-1A]OZE71329.1 transcriptional regulator [Rhodococcus sp. 15-725-2-2b]
MSVEQQGRRPAGFSSVLRGWRDRSAPVPSDSTVRPRRSSGLRREELATLAGISVDYLVQLEQGRASNPSAAVVAALVRALGLDLADAGVLYRAAGLAAPSSAVDRSVPDSVDRLLARADHWPTAVYAADWWLLRWNAALFALMGDPMDLSGHSRNQVWFEMTEDTSSMWVDPAQREQYRDALVGDLRVAQISHPDDAELDSLVRDLRARSNEFSDRWRSARPTVYRGARKSIDHPLVGSMVLDGDVFRPAGSDVRVIVYTAAPGSRDESRLLSLLSPGSRGRNRASIQAGEARCEVSFTKRTEAPPSG